MLLGYYLPCIPSRRFTVDRAKKEKFINIFLLMPETCVDDAMRSAKYTEEDIADLRMRRFLQRALPGGSIKGLKAYVAGLLPPQPHHNQRPMRSVDNAAIVANFDAAIVHVERTPPVTVNAVVNVEPRTMRQSMAVSSVTQAVANARFVMCGSTKTKMHEFIIHHLPLSRQLPALLQRRQRGPGR